MTTSEKVAPHDLYAETAAPRFSFGMLLLWVACCCAYLGWMRALNLPSAGWIGILILTATTIYAGACWAGSLLVLRRMQIGQNSIEPGQWLLLIVGIVVLIELVTAVAVRFVYVRPKPVLAALSCCVLVLPTLSRLPTRWKAFFCLLVLLAMVPLVIACAGAWGIWPGDGPIQALSIWNWVGSTLGLGLIAGVCWKDRKQSQFYSWLHWSGVTVFVMRQLLSFA